MEERGPWKTLKVEERYATPWISVSHHDVVDPSGATGIYGVIHFRNVAVGILVLDAEMNTWIVGQYRYPIQAYSWEIPEGGGARDIPTLVSAQRELREEAGITATTWTEILRMDLSNSASDEEAVVYLAQGLSFQTAEPDHNEELALRKLPFTELLELVLSGEVRDSITVAAVLKVEYLRANGLLHDQK